MKPKILTTIQTYSGPLFVADLFAGVTVALVAIPLSLAIAIASGADPAAGLVTAIIAGFLISFLGGSRVQIGGPTGAFIVVVFGVIVAHGYDGLVLATFMAGIILIVAGLMRAGNLISFVPEAVVNGFTIGIAIIIAASQLNDLFGLTTSGLPAEFFSKLEVLWAARGTVNWASVGIGAVTMVLIVGLRRVAPKFPGLIVAVGLTSAVVYLFHLPVDTIGSRFGALPSQLPMPKLPELSLDRVTELLPSAFVIAFLAGVESLLSAMVADRMTGGQYRRNAEVMAQGAANMGSALFGGLPATGAIARTATNVRAGGKTPVAGIVHAFTILMAVLFAAPLAGYLAMPALAGLLMLTAWNMSEPHKWRAYMSDEKANVALLLITLVLTVVADLTIAIGVGVSLGLAIRLRRRHVGPADWSEPER
ncbi:MULTISPECIES: SulP family inorganic anion transporter [unclassified Hyphomonas]|jgi:SulP family sulfate permease|uniref:SulP family inorganic anion transporter n=1 Tax=unclassified Hyphomonas TaxID=2630699 RepID=UPI000C68217A|nr:MULTISPECIES: SulP family inorganic anion transporter [unclassified Hyphomonas]MAL43352.1 sulfate permease [Hyphomonas sp.]MAX82651.1 sulfate permease [Hyphomonas sp.]HAW56153.1 sulfate permease [Hyphomonas sp.]HBJ39787.1 sulfate permease [Hyphomonas sp.]HBN91671.1 sulfate permease [Hyphomonas sp.]|tara:strand:- start:14327 stop:15589 length:1263 start_codon:yes stop_codon:yes gene_type:complete